MKNIANLLFEVRILKDIVRSGYAFLGSGKESIAEHSFMTAFICFAMAKMEHDIDREKLLSMALVHDIAEARTGDFNYVEKNYSEIDEAKAISHLIKSLSFGNDIENLMDEFNHGKTKEAELARDADQISFILELKKIKDTGAKGPGKWLPHVLKRLRTDIGRQIAQSIMETRWDEWWMNDYSE
ncbi:MAG: HD domain-containing protein [Deltaproteobacteria bacterium]|nr:HD domain-containing protein [Deltaproteobacteria bacterium]